MKFKPKECRGCGAVFNPTTPNSQYCTPNHRPVQSKEYFQEYHLANREKKIKAARDWSLAHPGRKQAYDAQRRKDKAAEIAKFKREAHARWLAGRTPEELASFREANRNKAASRSAAKRDGGVFNVTARDYRRAFYRQVGTCLYCSVEFTDHNPVEWDHVVPLSRGGTHSIGNLVASCRSCNRSKSHRTVMEFLIGKTVPRSGIPLLGKYRLG